MQPTLDHMCTHNNSALLAYSKPNCIQVLTHCVAQLNKVTVLAKQQLNTEWHCSGAACKEHKNRRQCSGTPQVRAWPPLPLTSYKTSGSIEQALQQEPHTTGVHSCST